MDKNEVVEKVVIEGIIARSSPLKIKIIGNKDSEKTVTSFKYATLANLFRRRYAKEFIGKPFFEVPIMETEKEKGLKFFINRQSIDLIDCLFLISTAS